MFSKDWDTLAEKIAEIRDLGSVASVLTWDQETFMPPKGMAARAEQLATIQGLYHERIVEPKLGELMATIESSDTLSEIHRAVLREFEI